jgi:ABC-type phosphate transport system substrate-binding protein
MPFLLTALPGSNRAAFGDVLEIKGDGSTLASPMYAKWIEDYGKVDPKVRFT